MKTAIQEIIDRANLGIAAHEKEILNHNNSTIEKNRHSYLLNVCKMFHELATSLLEKEKQHIIDAYFIAGQSIEDAEQYYNETFKND